MNAADDRKRFLWFDTTNRLRIEAGKKRIPLIGTFELTARCNLACSLCFVRRDAADRQSEGLEAEAEAWTALADEARREGTLFLLLTGGEPLLRPDFWSIYGPLSRMGFILTLYTNATLIGEAQAREFKRRPPAKAVVTLYGASAETYGAVCGHPEAFERAVAGIRRLVAAGVNTRVRATISRDNVGDLDALGRLAFELTGTRGIETSMMLTPPVRGACTRAVERRLSPEAMAALDRGNDLGEPDPGMAADGEGMTVSRLSGAIDVTKAGATDYGALPPMYCSGGRSSFWLAWDGRMLPCALMDRPYSAPFTDGFARAWRTLTEETDRIPGAGACQGCGHRAHCAVCPGRLQAETGSFTTVTPYLCDMARLLHDKETAAQQAFSPSFASSTRR